MFFESLEKRSLFSVSLSAGVLTVTGTALNDAIIVNKNGAGQLSVNDDGAIHNYAWASVNKIIVNALAGNDTVMGYNAVNKPMVIHGGDGNDKLIGGGANDVIFGDNGDDVIDGRSGDDDEHGGAGTDTADYSSARTNLSISLDNVADDGGIGRQDNVHSDIENVICGSGNDMVFGSPANNRIFGNGGNDVIGGGGGKDFIDGGPGDDYLRTGPGNATVNGGDGSDNIFGGTGTGTNNLNGGPGDDIIEGYGNVNIIHGNDGNDSIRCFGVGTTTEYGDAGDDKLRGSTGNGYNFMFGGAGNDQLWAGGGDSKMNGDDGDDTLVSVGGSQADVATGGNGMDSFWVDAERTEKTTDVSAPELARNCEHRVDAFYGGVSRERIGQNLPDPWAYDASGAGYYPDLNNFSEKPLFASTGPGENDVIQGQVGDCYLMAGLSGTAKADPLRIRQSVVDLGDGTYAVEFETGPTPNFIRVDADLPTYNGSFELYYAKFGAEGAIWAPIMEKAFAFWRSGQDSYGSIDSGYLTEPFKAMGGTFIESVWGATAQATMDNIYYALAAGKQVSVGTPNVEPTNGCPCVASHAYTVDHVNYDSYIFQGRFITYAVSITLRNPWGYDGAGTDSNPTDGYVTVDADQFYGYFNEATSAFV